MQFSANPAATVRSGATPERSRCDLLRRRSIGDTKSNGHRCKQEQPGLLAPKEVVLPYEQYQGKAPGRRFRQQPRRLQTVPARGALSSPL